MLRIIPMRMLARLYIIERAHARIRIRMYTHTHVYAHFSRAYVIFKVVRDRAITRV